MGKINFRGCKKHHKCKFGDCTAANAKYCVGFEPYVNRLPVKTADWKSRCAEIHCQANRSRAIVANMKEALTYINYLVYVLDQRINTLHSDCQMGENSVMIFHIEPLGLDVHIAYIGSDLYIENLYTLVPVDKICPIEDNPHQRCCTIEDCPYPGSLCEAAHLHPCHGCSRFQTGMESVEQHLEHCYCEKPKLMILDPQRWAELSSSEQEEVMKNELGCGGFR